MKEQIEYCCTWCHEPLPKTRAYVTSKGSIVCSGCRGLGVILNKWNKPCKRRHSVEPPTPAPIAASE